MNESKKKLTGGQLAVKSLKKEKISLDILYNKERTIDFIIRGEGEFRYVEFLNNFYLN